MEIKINQATVKLVLGDITQQTTEAIVNAANNSLLGGGGVDGAIHRAGGTQILEACKKLGGCDTGDAKITTGGKLNAKYVIHTVGPVWSGGNHGEDGLLISAYKKSLAMAEEHRIKSISFPSISTGAYRFPVDRAAALALTAVVAHLRGTTGIGQVNFVLFSDDNFAVYKKELEKLTA
jgi:O-acetyl-ADP-ribose deacetylase